MRPIELPKGASTSIWNPQDGMKLGPVNVAGAIQRAIDREAAGPTVRGEPPEDLDVLADPDYLHRSLANLIRNALRYAGQGSEISISPPGCPEITSVATIFDNGPGLPADALGKVFRRFYRVEDSPRPALQRRREVPQAPRLAPDLETRLKGRSASTHASPDRTLD